MAYDEALAAAVRDILDDQPDVVEKAMFGGLAFLVNGNMAVAAGGDGELMVRVDRDAHDDLAAEPDAEGTVMRGRVMRGWISARPTSVDRLRLWVRRGRDYTLSLPPKRR